MKIPHILRGLAVLVLAASLGAQSVHVVDASGSGDFTQLFQAVAAATEGDVILVRSDAFLNAITVDKGLTIVGEGATPKQTGLIEVIDLPLGSAVTLRNLQPIPEPFFDVGRPAVSIEDCDGSVLLEDVVAVGPDSTGSFTTPPPGGPGLRISDGAAVTVVRCTLTGGDGRAADSGFPGNFSSEGGPGLLVEGGNAALTGCTVTGGPGGGQSGTFDASRAGHGAEVSSCRLFLSGCAMTGGAMPFCGAGNCPASGSDGLHATVAGEVLHLDSSFLQGPAFLGPMGVPVFTSGSVTVTDLAEISRQLAVDAPVVSLEAGTLSYSGEQGDTVGLLYALATSWTILPGKKGVYGLGTPAFGPFTLFTVSDPGGSDAIPFVAPDLSPAAEGITVRLQAIAQDSEGKLRLTNPTALVVIDDGV